MYDISEILRSLLDQYSRVNAVDREFERMLSEDKNLKQEYKIWCEEHGYDNKTGYQDYLDELIESRDQLWEEEISEQF